MLALCASTPLLALAEEGSASSKTQSSTDELGLKAGGVAASGLTSQDSQDLQFLGLTGDAVSGSVSAGYTVYLRDGDAATVTLSLKNNSGEDLEYVTMTKFPSYPQNDGNSGDDENFEPIEFSPLNRYRPDEGVTGAEYDFVQRMTSDTTGERYSGYSVEKGASPTFQMQVDAGDLATGTYDWTIQLGRVRYDYQKTIVYYNGQEDEEWPCVKTEVEEVYTQDIPITVVIYNQEGAKLKVGKNTGDMYSVNIDPLTSAGVDMGTFDLAGDESALTGSFNIMATNDGAENVFVDAHNNTTSITVDFDGEITSADAALINASPFSWGNGTLYDTNWDPLPPKTVDGGSVSLETASYTMFYDATSLIAGTYTCDFIVNTTPHKVMVNGVAGNDSGVYRYPFKITLTGTNPRLLPRAENLTATAGNGRVDLAWTTPESAGEYAEYTIYRREGAETQTDPDKLDWSLYEEIGTKVKGTDGEMVYVDGDVENGKTYSYTVLCGTPYRGYAAKTASAEPLASIESKMFAPSADAYYGLNCVEVSWKMNDHYGGSEFGGEGMVDHFNVYRDDVLVDQVYRSAVIDEVTYGWHDDGTGTDTQVYGVTGHNYTWQIEEPVPELYTPYNWAVSAVSPSGAESDLSEGTVAYAYGEAPAILGHVTWLDEETEFYDDDTWKDYPVVKILAETSNYGSNIETLSFWRNEGSTTPDVSGSPYATCEPHDTYESGMYDFADENITLGETYTYAMQGVDGDGNKTNVYTFTVKAVEDADFGSTDVEWSVLNGTMARMQWYCDYYWDDDAGDYVYVGTYKVYRNDELIKTLTDKDSDDHSFDYRDDPGADGTYAYRVDKVVSGVTVRGRTFTFERNTQPVDVSSLLQPPDAPALSGRTSGESNIVLSWTPAATGGAPEGYHVYRKDAGKQVLAGRYVSRDSWAGSSLYWKSWGNGRYITLPGADTTGFVDGGVDNSSYYKGDSRLGDIVSLNWNNDNLPHEYYITAYNRAGESEPSQLVVFDTAVTDEYGNAIAPGNEASELPAAPSITKAWVDWDDGSSYQSGFDDYVHGYVRVAWSDSGMGGDIDKWTATFAGTHNDVCNPPQTDELSYYQAVMDPASKLGNSESSPTCGVNGYSGDNGDLGRTITVSVAAENSLGVATSETVDVDLLSFPRFYALPDNGGAVLRWTDLVEDDSTEVTGWEIWRKSEHGLWERVTELSGTLEYAGQDEHSSSGPVSYYEWSDTGLDNGWTYQYKVVAKCSDGNDRPGVVREVTPERTAAAEAPGAPRNLSAQVVNGTVVFSWDAPESGGAVGSYQPLYEYQYTYDSSPSWYAVGGTVSGDSLTQVWVPSKAGTYKFSVYSYSYIDGESVPENKYASDIDGFENMSSAEKLDALYATHSNIVEVEVTQDQIDQQSRETPDKPELTVVSDDGQITISWPACANAVRYEVSRTNSAYPKMTDRTIAAVPEQQTYTFVDADAEPGVKYLYRVWAYSSTDGIYADVYARASGKTRDQLAAEQVEALIAGLPSAEEISAVEVGSDEFKAYETQVADVEEVYDALTDKQKSYVSDTALAQLEDAGAALVACKYAAVVGPVQDLVDALPSASDCEAAAADGDESKLDEYAAAISAARAAYDAISPAEAKQGVDITALVAAEQAIEQARQRIDDQKAANEVAALINNLPDDGALEDDDAEAFATQCAAISDARKAYNALTSAQRQLISEDVLAKLQACEQRVSELEEVYADKEAAAAVVDAIGKLPDPASDEFTLANAGAVASARSAYDALTSEQRAYVDADSMSKLSACEQRIEELKEQLAQMETAQAAAAVDEMIGAIENIDDLDNMTLASGSAIREAREAYEKISDEAKQLVTSLGKLEGAEARLAVLEAQAVEQLIAKLPDASEITLDDEAAVVAARQAFDALTEAQRGYLTDAAQPRLEAAEARIAELKAQAAEAARVDISKGAVTLAAKTYTYDGKAKKPTAKLVVDGKTLNLGADYTVRYQDNVNAGSAKAVLTGVGAYKGEVTAAFTIGKAANKLSVKAKAKKIKVKKSKKKKKVIKKAKAFVVSGAQGAVTFAKVKGNKKISVAANGNITLKKKLKKKKTYSLTVRVTASGNTNYASVSKIVKLKIRVK